MIFLALTIALVALILCATRSRRLGSRLRSLTHPLHELRGAMAALELGLTALERSARRVEPRSEGGGLADRIDALRAQLERLALAADDLDARRQGISPPLWDVRRAGVDLATVARRSVLAWSTIAQERGTRIELRWEAGETPVPGTAGRLRQVLDNLIGNAIEHGGGRVLVRGEAVPDSVRVTVSDEGRGLPIQPDDWIEAPWRSARGHGLAISRAMIAAYGGRLAARTTADGPGVAFELPLLAHAPSISSRERVAPPRQRRKEGSAEAIAGAGGRRAA